MFISMSKTNYSMINNVLKRRLELKNVHSPDVPGPIEAARPDSPKDVNYYVELTIGYMGDPSADIFSVMITTPEALAARAPDKAAVLCDRSTIVVSEFDARVLRNHFLQILKECEAPTWPEATERLQRYFAWEYERMK